MGQDSCFKWRSDGHSNSNLEHHFTVFLFDLELHNGWNLNKNSFINVVISNPPCLVLIAPVTYHMRCIIWLVPPPPLLLSCKSIHAMSAPRLPADLSVTPHTNTVK